MRTRGKMILIAMIVAGCKKPYDPPAISAPGSYLVVEGAINSGSDSTTIRLSQTVNLSGIPASNPVLHASLTIENDQNAAVKLTEVGKGEYGTGGIALDNAAKYRLRIKTADNKEYLSDFVSVVNSPAIDSLSYTTENDGARFYVSTHDTKNSTKYYRWDYQETWMFHSNYDSHYKSNGDEVLRRDLINDEIYQCWGNSFSSSVNLGSTAKLSKDVIVNNLITSVPSTSEKFSIKYSILVKQYALTPDAYNFWVNLKKNTEQLGSIFDAQPSQVNGNIHSVTNPAEPVIGYISAGLIATKRIFVTNQQLPNWQILPTYNDCVLDTILLKYGVTKYDTINQENDYFNYNYTGGQLQFIPVDVVNGRPGQVLGHSGSLPKCVDCTLRGTNKKPAFWQ